MIGNTSLVGMSIPKKPGPTVNDPFSLCSRTVVCVWQLLPGVLVFWQKGEGRLSGVAASRLPSCRALVGSGAVRTCSDCFSLLEGTP